MKSTWTGRVVVYLIAVVDRESRAAGLHANRPPLDDDSARGQGIQDKSNVTPSGHVLSLHLKFYSHSMNSTSPRKWSQKEKRLKLTNVWMPSLQHFTLHSNYKNLDCFDCFVNISVWSSGNLGLSLFGLTVSNPDWLHSCLGLVILVTTKLTSNFLMRLD